MNIIYRMEDVDRLRLYVCQDFIRMILKDDWKQKMHEMIKAEVEKNGRFKNAYNETYKRIRRDGIEKYSVEDMDVTLINQLINSDFDGIRAVNRNTRDALYRVKEGRNLKVHSGKHEKEEDLYRQCMFALEDLRTFVVRVDDYEIKIEDEKRKEFLEKYNDEINRLQVLLDDERIELVQLHKEFDKDIKRVLESKDVNKAWNEVQTKLWGECMVGCKNDRKYEDFMIYASDAGISQAHIEATSVLFNRKEYSESEKRLLMYCKSNLFFSPSELDDVFIYINSLSKAQNGLTETLKDIIDILQRKDYKIQRLSNGLWCRKE